MGAIVAVPKERYFTKIIITFSFQSPKGLCYVVHLVLSYPVYTAKQKAPKKHHHQRGPGLLTRLIKSNATRFCSWHEIDREQFQHFFLVSPSSLDIPIWNV